MSRCSTTAFPKKAASASRRNRALTKRSRSMKRVARFVNNLPRILSAAVAFLFPLIVCVVTPARAEDPSGLPDVLAHGAGDTYWFGFVEKGEEKGDPDQ